MENKDKPAYPALELINLGEHPANCGGLSKREYIAGLAMQGLLSNPGQIDTTNFEWVAEHAIGYADELLKQLNKAI